MSSTIPPMFHQCRQVHKQNEIWFDIPQLSWENGAILNVQINDDLEDHGGKDKEYKREELSFNCATKGATGWYSALLENHSPTI